MKLRPLSPFRWREPAANAAGAARNDHHPAVRLPWPLGGFVFFRGPDYRLHPACGVPDRDGVDHGFAFRAAWRLYRIHRAPGDPHPAPTEGQRARVLDRLERGRREHDARRLARLAAAARPGDHPAATVSFDAGLSPLDAPDHAG